MNAKLADIYSKSSNREDMIQGLFRAMNFVHTVEEMYAFVMRKFSSASENGDSAEASVKNEASDTSFSNSPENGTAQGAPATPPLKIIQFSTPPPPSRPDEHLSNLYTNKVQSLHSVWILQANRRKIVSDWEMEQLLCVIFNGDFRYPIYQLMCTLYEALTPKDDTDAYYRWNPIGNMLLKELLSLIDKRVSEQ
jgi:hypothetical protein